MKLLQECLYEKSKRQNKVQDPSLFHSFLIFFTWYRKLKIYKNGPSWTILVIFSFYRFFLCFIFYFLMNILWITTSNMNMLFILCLFVSDSELLDFLYIPPSWGETDTTIYFERFLRIMGLSLENDWYPEYGQIDIQILFHLLCFCLSLKNWNRFAWLIERNRQ